MPRVATFNREEIIEKAMNVFWKRGYHGTSMQDLVDATGLNRSSIYNSFGSKKALYRTTLNQYEEASNKSFRQVLLRANCPLGALRKMLELASNKAKSDNEGRGCYISSCKIEMAQTDMELREWLVHNQQNGISLFKELIAQGQEEGVINTAQNPESYAYLVYNTFQGLRITGILERDGKTMDQIIKNTIKILE